MATRKAPRKSAGPARRPVPKPRLRANSGGPKKQAVKKHLTSSEQDESRFVGRYVQGRAKVSSKGWIVIPKEIRDEMGLHSGDEVTLALWPPPLNMKQDRGLYSLYVERVPEDPVALGRGLFARKPGEPSLAEELVEEHRHEVERDEREMREWRKQQRRRTA
jgi:AbrB family looped-hinge helix DNA binding protein